MQTEFTIRRRILATAVMFSGVLLSGGISSCAKECSLPIEEQQVAIAPSAMFTQGTIEALSKAPVDGVTQPLKLYLVRADESAVGSYGAYGSTALSADRAAGSGVTALTFSSRQYYQPNGFKTKMTGWYPVAEAFTGGVVSWTFDGKKDIMTAPKREGDKKSAMPSFAFEHRLAQLQFFPYADNERITKSWGKITNIEILSQANQATYNVASEAVAFSGNVVFSAGVASAGVSIATSKATALMVGDAVMIAPQNSDSYVLTLRITTEKEGVKTVPITHKFEAGVPYKILLRFVQLEMIITPEITISDWVEGYNSNVQTDPVTEPGIDMGDWETGKDESIDY